MELDPNLVSLATGVGIAIAAAIAYLKKPGSPGGGSPGEDNLHIVGGALSDRTSMRILAESNLTLAAALNRVAAGVESYNDEVHDQGVRDQAREDWERRRPPKT